MTSCTRSAWRILGDLKKVSWVENWTPNEKGWLPLVEALDMCHTRCWGGDRWKSQNRKNVYLSPYVEKPLNSKVIKSFVPELRSRVFRVSGFLCSMYICYEHYEHYMYISHICIMDMVQEQFFIYTQFKCQNSSFQTIQFTIITQLSSIWPTDNSIRDRGTLHSLKLQDYWSLTIRLLSVIPWTIVGGVLPLCKNAVSVFSRPSWQCHIIEVYK